MSTMFLTRLFAIVVCSSLLKFLLFPAAHSTDLEVHRHWKALTVSRPLSQWYHDESSKWTLDYPPIFAYYEYIVGQLLSVFRPSLVDITNHDDSTWRTVYFLRATVLALDPLLALSASLYLGSLQQSTAPSNRMWWRWAPPTRSEESKHLFGIILLLFNPSLIIVDNIHFQYNILAISCLFLSLFVVNASAFSLASIGFAVTVNLKHTLFPLALPLVIYVLAYHYHCLSQPQTQPHNNDNQRSAITNAALSIVCTAFATTLALVGPWVPFFITGGLPLLMQMKQRLFPFDRGLFHANWAPNLWAFYAVCDKVASRLGCRLRVPDVSITSGHIGSVRPFTCLPNPTPSICFTLLVISTTPILIHLANSPSKVNLLHAIVITALSSVLFGWHVHEKALLIALLPLSLLVIAGESMNISQHSQKKSNPFIFALLLLNPATNIAVLDLVAGDASIVFARFFCYGYFLFLLAALKKYLNCTQNLIVSSYAISCTLVELYANVGGHRIIFSDSLPFLPKLVVSLTSFIGVMSTYIVLSV